MDKSREIDIIVRVLRGDRNAYALLVDEYKGPIFNLVYRLTFCYQDAHDLTQETFLRAYEALKSFDTRKRFFSWLYIIGLNLIRNHLGKEREFPLLETIGEPAHRAWEHNTDNPEHALIKDQEIEQLDSLLQKLPLDMREAVVLRFYQELSFEDISEILGISLSSAKMRVYRGLEKLRLLMPGKEKW